ncbi:hypothetical protein [Kitasatospora aureofaciens]|uniref:hypothetical protein n=1 Tax=Kitasatospora aureofaciens TaxID=1894 RepID=UPI001C45F23D|nr:hypothetical protein [Kitasatospora aureofaciens]MBV6695518.1 hypothetical protein [Kitasatospora aureofaciens]
MAAVFGNPGWTAPHFRAADTADLWTWLIIVGLTQLRLVRLFTADLCRPWEACCRQRS